MTQNSKIEWTHHTANLWHGCTKVHAGCDNCYAETLSHRWGKDIWGNDKPRQHIRSFFKDLARYQSLAKDAHEVHRVFVGSMMDIFEKPMPLITASGEPYIGDDRAIYHYTDICNNAEDTGDLRDMFFQAISKGYYPNLMFLLLTKRPSNINSMIPEHWKINPPANVMFGTSPVDQKTANTLIPQLLRVRGEHFLSVEPQLGPVIFRPQWAGDTMEVVDPEQHGFIDWVIQGGESGAHRRPFDLQWAKDMRAQCSEYSIPYFFKQVDKVIPIPEDMLVRQFPEMQSLAK